MNEPGGQIQRRSIGVVFADGGLLALSAVRPGGSGGHGEEEVAAVLCGADGAPVEVSEALLSTEYGPDGVQRRATLELWLDDEDGQPLRGAGTLISAASVSHPGLVGAADRWLPLRPGGHHLGDAVARRRRPPAVLAQGGRGPAGNRPHPGGGARAP